MHLSHIKKHFHYFIPAFIWILAGCGSTPSPLSEYGPALENIMKSETGVFRGLSLGSRIDSVLKKESGKANEADENYLYYEYSLDTIGSYNVAYTFDEKGLSEIQSDIYINNQANTDNIFNSFKNYFDEHYGPSAMDKGYTVWSVKSDLYGEVKITLNNESSDFSIPNSPGKVSLLIYPDKE